VKNSEKVATSKSRKSKFEKARSLNYKNEFCKIATAASLIRTERLKIS
jgi:hypothetical protein